MAEDAQKPIKYTGKYFKSNFPDWKRDRDATIVRFSYRPISFYAAAFAANRGITANAVSYFSVFVGIAGCGCFFAGNYICAIVGALLLNCWLVLDCVDGNLARSVRAQPFGEFADSVSSYILVGLMNIAMGFYVYRCGGVFSPQGSALMLLLGALASEADTLMRLVYQKYKAVERELADAGKVKVTQDIRTDHTQGKSLQMRIEMEFGTGGILPALILISVIFGAVDIVVMYCLAYYGGSCLVTVFRYVRKAIRAEKTKP